MTCDMIRQFLRYMAMPLKITTWNINSVRLRIDLVAKFFKAVAAGRAVPAGNQMP